MLKYSVYYTHTTKSDKKPLTALFARFRTRDEAERAANLVRARPHVEDSFVVERPLEQPEDNTWKTILMFLGVLFLFITFMVVAIGGMP